MPELSGFLAKGAMHKLLCGWFGHRGFLEYVIQDHGQSHTTTLQLLLDYQATSINIRFI